jgi:multisubunit Na+/H+ antiporter MnhG subunit
MGLVLLIIGGILMLGGKIGLGKLPGDIFIKRGNFTFFFPIVSSIIISLILTILFNLFRK